MRGNCTFIVKARHAAAAGAFALVVFNGGPDFGGTDLIVMGGDGSGRATEPIPLPAVLVSATTGATLRALSAVSPGDVWLELGVVGAGESDSDSDVLDRVLSRGGPLQLQLEAAGPVRGAEAGLRAVGAALSGAGPRLAAILRGGVAFDVASDQAVQGAASAGGGGSLGAPSPTGGEAASGHASEAAVGGESAEAEGAAEEEEEKAPAVPPGGAADGHDSDSRVRRP